MEDSGAAEQEVRVPKPWVPLLGLALVLATSLAAYWLSESSTTQLVVTGLAAAVLWFAQGRVKFLTRSYGGAESPSAQTQLQVVAFVAGAVLSVAAGAAAYLVGDALAGIDADARNLAAGALALLTFFEAQTQVAIALAERS